MTPRPVRKAALLTLFTGALILLPFLGLAEFNTKGEPREAVVSLTMLSEGNWILPTNNGGDIPYKPPMLHWMIAAFSWLDGGHVTEYSSRLPSALALIGMAVATTLFFSRRRRSSGSPGDFDVETGLLTGLLTLTAFETYRAGMACRVDMLLTAFTVGALYLLYRWWNHGMKGLPWLAILLMGCATLTKGPVGILVPCLCAGIFFLLRGVNFWRAFLSLLASALIALIIPLFWYVPAYDQGGAEFWNLVMEENFGRMTGAMTYESHVNPWPYNVATLLAGFLPWTIICVAALFCIRKTNDSSGKQKGLNRLAAFCKRCFGMLAHSEPKRIFAFVCAAVIFIFYCLPSSKRSVYLMPMYPFTAFFVAELMLWLTKRHVRVMRGFAWGFASLCILLFAVYASIQIAGPGTFESLKPRTAAMLCALAGEGMDFWSQLQAWCWISCALAGAALFCFYSRRLPAWGNCLGLVCTIYIALSGCILPAVLGAKSVKDYAHKIQSLRPDIQGNLYEYIRASETAKGNPIHFFELDFYTGDGIRNFIKEKPESGYVLIERGDTTYALDRFEREGYHLRPLLYPAERRPKHTPILYRFSHENPPTSVVDASDAKPHAKERSDVHGVLMTQTSDSLAEGAPPIMGSTSSVTF